MVDDKQPAPSVLLHNLNKIILEWRAFLSIGKEIEKLSNQHKKLPDRAALLNDFSEWGRNFARILFLVDETYSLEKDTPEGQ